MIQILDAGLLALNRALMAVTAALILLMTIVVTADVVGRNLSLFALPWSAEVGEYGLYLSAVLVAPWLLRRGQHVSVGVVTDLLPARVARAVIAVGEILCAIVSAILFWYALQAAMRSYSDQALVIKNIVFPEWWTLVPITMIFGILALEFAVQCLSGTRNSAPAVL